MPIEQGSKKVSFLEGKVHEALCVLEVAKDKARALDRPVPSSVLPFSRLCSLPFLSLGIVLGL